MNFPDLQDYDIICIDYKGARFFVSKSGEVTAESGNKTRVSGFGYLMTRSPETWCYHHVIVCTAFHGENPGGMRVDHIDGNKLNNAPENLRWITHAENIKKGWANKNGPWKNKKGRDHPLSIPVEATKEGKTIRFAGVSEAARTLNLCQQNVWKVVAGHRKTCGGWRFSYAIS